MSSQETDPEIDVERIKFDPEDLHGSPDRILTSSPKPENQNRFSIASSPKPEIQNRFSSTAAFSSSEDEGDDELLDEEILVTENPSQNDSNSSSSLLNDSIPSHRQIEDTNNLLNSSLFRSNNSHNLVKPTPLLLQQVLSSQTNSSPLAAMYAARLRNEADYLRYRACKDNNNIQSSFYARLATLSALQSYGNYYNNIFKQQLIPPGLPPPQISPIKPPVFSSPNSEGRISSPPFSPDSSGVKRKLNDSLDSNSSCSSTVSKANNKPPHANSKQRKIARKLAFDDLKTSPVSGTLIRELAEGEEIPAIRKGKSFGFFSCPWS